MTSTKEPFWLLSETPMKYCFTLTDNKANGICCDYGTGSYQLWLGEHGKGILIAEGEDFVFEASHEFVVYETLTAGYMTMGIKVMATSLVLLFGSMTTTSLSSAMILLIHVVVF